MTEKQILEQLISSAPFQMIVSFAISLFLCLMLLPISKERVSVGVTLSVLITLLAFVFPLYLYTFFLMEGHELSAGKILRSLILTTVFIAPHWLLLVILSTVVFARHFRTEGRSYLIEAAVALTIGGAGAAYASAMTTGLFSKAFD
jgi:hypothetical protein